MNKQRMQTLAGLLNESKRALNERAEATIIKNNKETVIQLPKKYVVICHTSTSDLPDAEEIVGKFRKGYYLKGDWKNLNPLLQTLEDMEDEVTTNFEKATIFTSHNNLVTGDHIFDALLYSDDNDKEYIGGNFFEPLEVEVTEESIISVKLKKTGKSYTRKKITINGKPIK